MLPCCESHIRDIPWTHGMNEIRLRYLFYQMHTRMISNMYLLFIIKFELTKLERNKLILNLCKSLSVLMKTPGHKQLRYSPRDVFSWLVVIGDIVQWGNYLHSFLVIAIINVDNHCEKPWLVNAFNCVNNLCCMLWVMPYASIFFQGQI